MRAPRVAAGASCGSSGDPRGDVQPGPGRRPAQWEAGALTPRPRCVFVIGEQSRHRVTWIFARIRSPRRGRLGVASRGPSGSEPDPEPHRRTRVSVEGGLVGNAVTPTGRRPCSCLWWPWGLAHSPRLPPGSAAFAAPVPVTMFLGREKVSAVLLSSAPALSAVALWGPGPRRPAWFLGARPPHPHPVPSPGWVSSLWDVAMEPSRTGPGGCSPPPRFGRRLVSPGGFHTYPRTRTF